MNLLYDYIVSLANLYGLVHKKKVIEIYNEQNKEQVDLDTIEQIMRQDEQALEKDFVMIENNYFVHEAIWMFEDFNKVLIERMGKPFYIPSKQELLKYKDDLYFEKTKEYNALLRYVTKNISEGDKEQAVDICEEIQARCQFDFSPSRILGLFDRIGIALNNKEQVEQLFNLVIDLANNTRIRENNGFTPNELFSMQNSDEITAPNNTNLTATKVRRNDPCTCGSGKKYKKCCLM